MIKYVSLSPSTAILRSKTRLNVRSNVRLFSLSCKCDSHSVGRGDLEPVKSAFSIAGLVGVLEFNERNVGTTGDEPNLFVALELVEEHGQHGFVGFLREVGEEEDGVWNLHCWSRGWCRGRNRCWHSLRNDGNTLTKLLLWFHFLDFFYSFTFLVSWNICSF